MNIYSFHSPLHREANITTQWLSNCQIIKTSEDIAAEISPMVEIDINVLSEMMLARGYAVVANGSGVVGWLVNDFTITDKSSNDQPSAQT